MIKTAIKDIQTGSYTATPVYTKTGQMILSAHTLLTAQQVSRLEFYGIEWINIQEPSDITENADSGKQEEPVSYSQKVKVSKEFHTFKVDYDKKSRYLESSFDDLLNKNIPVESRALIDQVSTLYADRLTSLSVFDMLHNMRQIDDTTFAHSINVALIGRMLGEWLELSEEEREQARADMSRMLACIDKMGELDTTGVEPMSHVFPVQNVFREDVVTNGDMREQMLLNAPEEKDGMFVAPRTFE